MSESANEAGAVAASQPATGDTAPAAPVEQPAAPAPPAAVVAAAPTPAPVPTPTPIAAEPSIVVDDAALAAVAVQALNARPAEIPANGTGNGHAEPWSEAPMTAHDADRFASRFKASWDVEEPAAAASASTSGPRPASPSIPSPGVWADTSREEVALPMQRTTRSPIFWGGIALVLGVCGILIALMTGSHSDEATAAAATARTTGTAAVPTLAATAPTNVPALPPATSPFGAAPAAGSVAPVIPPPVVVPPPPPVVVPPPPVVVPPPPPVVVAPPPPVVVAPPPPVVVPPPPPVVHVAPPPPVVVAPPPPVVHVAPPPPVHVAPPPPPPPMAHLVVHTNPPTAHLTLDGVAIANPFDGRLARSGTRHLAATAAGYDTATQTIDLSRDRTVTLTLNHQRVAAPAHPPSHPPPSHSHGGHTTTHGHANSGHGGFVSANPFD